MKISTKQKLSYSLLIVLVATFFIYTPLFIILLGGVLAYQVIQYESNKEKVLTPKDVIVEPILNNKYMPYHQKMSYLHSDQWKQVKRKVLKRDGHHCQSCGSSLHLEVHHVTYDRLGNEDLSDLVTLCNSCHSKLHAKLGYSVNKNYPIKILKEIDNEVLGV